MGRQLVTEAELRAPCEDSTYSVGQACLRHVKEQDKLLILFDPKLHKFSNIHNTASLVPEAGGCAGDSLVMVTCNNLPFYTACD